MCVSASVSPGADELSDKGGEVEGPVGCVVVGVLLRWCGAGCEAARSMGSVSPCAMEWSPVMFRLERPREVLPEES